MTILPKAASSSLGGKGNLPRRRKYGARHEETYLEIIDGLNKEKPTPEARSPRYIIGLVTSTRGACATVALLACFAVVVMPSHFTVAPNRRAGLPSPADRMTYRMFRTIR